MDRVAQNLLSLVHKNADSNHQERERSALPTMIKRIHHAQISIPRDSEKKARDFYCGVLGLSEVNKPENLKNKGGCWLQLGDFQVHLGVEDGVNRLATKSHVAFEVTDLSHWEARLLEEGIEVIDGLPIPGYERFEFRDPFGNRLEMLQRL
jgi:catechol 2,3-dioxygenase-like lactoylglutathione lyase family enzyme